MSTKIDIIGIGMVTAVGLDAPSACAAMRAGIEGFQETRFMAPGGDWLIGAPIPLPNDWKGEERMARIAAAALSEAARGQECIDTPILLCLAEDRPGRPFRDSSALLTRIAEIAEFPWHPMSRVVAHGRPSGMVALDLARRLIYARKADNVMIVGVDTYLQPETIDHFLERRRLLSMDVSDGFIPGEGAAALLCSAPRSGRLCLFGLGLSRETAFLDNPDDLPLRGDGMTAAYRTALEETGIAASGIGYRISDLIGEQFWFKQTALAAMRLVRAKTDFMDLWSPGETLGNIGAAVVPLMIGRAWEAARKEYAPGNPVLVEASGDNGACGAAVLGARAL